MFFIISYFKKNRLFSKGAFLFEKRDFAGALDCFEKITALDPNMGLAFVNKGLCLEKLGRYAQAKEAFIRGRDLFPNNPVPSIQLGIMCLDRNNPKEGITHFTQALQVDPTHPEALYQMGLAYIHLGDINSAVSAFERVVGDRQHFVMARILAAAEKMILAQDYDSRKTLKSDE